MKEGFELFEKSLPGLEKNVLLKKWTTFRIGGPARYFYMAQNKEDLIKTINKAKKFKVPIFILGGGSNLLVSDHGFDGIVIKLQTTNYKIENNEIFAEAGLLLSKLTQLALENSLTGLEWSSGIPGTIGGAIRGNAGAFNESMSDSVRSLEVYDSENNQLIKFNKNQCQFDYRESIFKEKNNLIILSAQFLLKKGVKEKIKNKMREIIIKRKKKQPLGFSSAGSIFKNPGISRDYNKKEKILSAGELIERCNLRGKKIGDVQISNKHANFIVNLEEGKAEDVIKIIKLIKREVKNKFKISLEEEIQYLGFKF